MEGGDIKITDIGRMLFGDVPGVFYIELVIRAVFVYFLISIGMKLMGKRLTAELSRSELAAVSTLASATGLIIMAPERGMLPPLIVVSALLTMKWILHRINFRNARFERISEGALSTLVKDGVMDLNEMKRSRISTEQLFAQLRSMEVVHLGEVKRLYLEANGTFSMIPHPHPRPGLPVTPTWDEDMNSELHFQEHDDTCSVCGTDRALEVDVCPVCGKNKWVRGVSSAA